MKINTTKLSRVLGLFCFIFFFSIQNSYSQDYIWQKAENTHQYESSKISVLKPISSFNLNAKILENKLSGITAHKTGTLFFPKNNNNGYVSYIIKETKVMHPILEKKFSNIKSYTGVSVEDYSKTIQFTYSSDSGFYGTYNVDDGQKVQIKPLHNARYQFDFDTKNSNYTDFECGTEAEARNLINKSGAANRDVNDGYLRRFRLALSVSGEYSQYFLDGSETNDAERKIKVLQAMVSAINRLNSIFERDLGVTMQLISNNDELIFLNPDTDPYSSGIGTLGNELSNTLNSLITDSDYDVGHLFHRENSKYGSAGCIACVCTSFQKGQGFSVHSVPDSFDMDTLAAHEFGHQFGAYHTQSSLNCRSAIGTSEVEPGSGSTIMSYAGICSPNVQPFSDDYFNYTSIRDIAAHTIENSSCAELIPSGNSSPIVNAGANYVIPKSTPFVLEGQVTDPDGTETLTYCWEQNDPENPNSYQSPEPTNALGPMFRSFTPTGSNKRYFPNLNDVVANNLSTTWEVLPSISRDLNFVLTVRDNGIDGGQIASDAILINVNDEAGPFTVTSQSTTPETWTVGDLVTITWDVANTSAAPVNASSVEVFVSTDGGLTFPTSIITTDNDGQETFILPDVDATSEARILIKAVDNVFFAVNQQNFTIEKSEYTILSETTFIDVCDTEEAVFNLEYKTYLTFDETVNLAVSNVPSGVNLSLSQDTFTGMNIDGTPLTATLSNLESLTPGTYTFNIDGISTSNIQKSIALTLNVFSENNVSLNLIFPEDNSDSLEPDLDFSWENDTNSSSYEVEIANDMAFASIIDTAIIDTNLYRSLNLENNQQYFWRVRTINPCGNSSFSDVFTFTTSCIAPTGFNAINISGTEASFEWSAEGAEGNWEIEYGLAGFNIGDGTPLSVSTPTVNISGLTPLISYDVYIKTVCEVGGFSDNLGPYTFSTLELCSQPFNLNMVSVTNDTAIINWENLNTDISKWEVEYGVNGFSQGSGTIAEVAEKTISIENLTSNSEYQFYVRSNCDADGYSNWVGPFNFETPPDYCNGDRFFDSGGEFGNYSNSENRTTVIYPKTADERIRVVFNSFSLETCCDYLAIYDGPDVSSPFLGNFRTNPNTITSSHETGALTFLFRSDGSVTRSGWDATVVCEDKPNCFAPSAFNISNIEARQADFSWLQDDAESNWTLEYGERGFVVGTGVGTELISNTLNETIVGLTPDTAYDIYIKTNCEAGGFSDINGPIEFTTPVACFVPQDLLVSSVSTNAANLQWDAGFSNENQWEIEYGTSGFTFGEGTRVSFATNVALIQGLTSNTTYDVYVRANCETEGFSNWSSAVTFKTDCDVLVAPFKESFEAFNQMPDCWNQSANGSWSFNTYAGYDANNIQDRNTLNNSVYAWLDASVNSNDEDYVLETPWVDISSLNNPSISFSVFSKNTINNIYNTLSVTLKDSNGVAFTDIVVVNYNTSIWKDFVLDLSDYALTSNTVQLEFSVMLFASWDKRYNDILIDEVNFDELPSCTNPINPTISNVTGATAELFWESTDDETNWEIQYGFSGFTTSGGTTKFVTEIPFMFTGLEPERSYDVYIRAVCGIGDSSDFIGPLSFSTTELCVTPVNFNFVSATKNTAELTWDASDGGEWEIEYSPNYFNPGIGIGVVETALTSSITLENLVPDTYYYAYVRRNCGVDGFSNWNNYIVFRTEVACVSPTGFFAESVTKNTASLTWGASDGAEWEIEYSPNYFNPGTGAGVIETTLNNSKTLENLLPDTYYYAYVRRNCDTDGYSNWSNYIFFRTEVACVSPTGFYVEAVSKNMAELAWDASDGGEWEIEYSPNYFNPGNGIGIVETALTNSITLEGLLPGTYYYAYVRRNCDTDGYSNWNGYIYFQTEEACAVPNNFINTDVSSTAADFSWEQTDTENSWTIEYGLQGFALGVGTELVVNSTTATISDLEASTSYDIYIKTNCEDGEFSRVNGPLNFVTDCILVPSDNNLISNGSFECESFTAWTTSGPNGSGCSQDFIVLSNSSTVCTIVDNIWPTDGNYAAFTSFDSGIANTTYGLHQSISVPNDINTASAAMFSFDFKVNYDMTFNSPTQEREFKVRFVDSQQNELFVVTDIAFGILEDTGSINLEFEENILSNLQNYAGETITLNFEAFVPEATKGPSKALIDNVSLIIDDSILSAQDDDLSENTFLVYPNPNNGTFMIHNKTGDLIEDVEIFDVSGRLIQRFKQNTPTRKISITLSEAVNAGVYFVKTHTYKSVTTKRIIIE